LAVVLTRAHPLPEVVGWSKARDPGVHFLCGMRKT
jgi:hypothetical protein